MDYKKKYEEALERAAGLITRENKDIAEYIFPELKENKNEVMINEIIAYLDAQDALTKGKDIDFKNWIAWLRKQSEITPTEDELKALRIAAYEPVKNWSKELQSLYEKLKYCNKNNNKPSECVSIVDYNGEK